MRLPSTRSLEAIASLARLKSLAAAGSDIGMSVPALSRRLALLEADLGVALFERLPRGVALTLAGETYLATISPALELLRQASADAGKKDREIVRVTTIPGFAIRWLVPRLKMFEASFPDVEIDVRTSVAFEDIQRQGFDFAIRLAPDSTMKGPPFLPIRVLPVWGKGYSDGFQCVSELSRHTLLGPDHRPEFWAEWFGAYCPSQSVPRVREVDSLLLSELAIRGKGIAIGLEPLVTDLIHQRRLFGWTERSLRSRRSFHLVVGKARRSHAVTMFREWLQEQSG